MMQIGVVKTELDFGILRFDHRSTYHPSNNEKTSGSGSAGTQSLRCGFHELCHVHHRHSQATFLYQCLNRPW